MDQIIIALKGTPWWVYLLFLYVLWIGLRARNSRVASLKKMFILPGIIFLFSMYNMIEKYNSIADIFYFILFLIVGCILGYRITKPLPIRADRKKMLIKVPGTNIVLILILIIFSVKYFFGYYYATHTFIPEYIAFLRLATSGTISGMLLGRIYCYLQKFSKAHHEKLRIKK